MIKIEIIDENGVLITISLGGAMVKKHEHNWENTDNMFFVRGNNKGSRADAFCTECDMGALMSENGSILFHTIEKVEFKKQAK